MLVALIRFLLLFVMMYHLTNGQLAQFWLIVGIGFFLGLYQSKITIEKKEDTDES